MARAPVYIPPDSLVEFTVRTRRGRKLLRPTRDLTSAVLGVIGRALSQFDVRLHAFTFLSNHQHQLARVADAEQACGYIGYVNRHTSRAVKKLTGWEDDVWLHASIVPVLDDHAAFGRLRYILSNGVKEGLVRSPLDWPGPTGVHALLDETPIEACWRSARDPVHEKARQHPIVVHPLPAWSGHPPAHRRRLLEALIYEIEQDGIGRRAGRPPLGVAALRAQDPFEETELEDDHAAPLAHSSRNDLLERFCADREAFIAAFRQSRARGPTHHALEVPRTA